jgi:hypothetical protein
MQLKMRAKSLGVPVIYVNDNFGMWQSNLDEVIKHVCAAEDVRSNLSKDCYPIAMTIAY